VALACSWREQGCWGRRLAALRERPVDRLSGVSTRPSAQPAASSSASSRVRSATAAGRGKP
jgi:hypothetical protein